MTRQPFISATALLASALCFGFADAAKAQEPRYSSGWSNPDAPPAPQDTVRRSADLDAMVKELRSLTREAERQRAADPVFLSDLKDLARRYSWPWNKLVVFDDFRDGNLSHNPPWKVVSGSFEIKREGLITVTEQLQQSRPEEQQRHDSNDIAQQLLGGLLRDIARDRRSSQVYNKPRRAHIYLPQQIPNRFALTVKMRSRTTSGDHFEFGVGQGKNAIGYYLVYRAGGSPSLSLIRKNSRGQAVIDAIDKPLKLSDGKLHTLLITRDHAGHMTVAMDGETKFRVRDRSFRDPFDRFVITNHGGAYAIRSLAIHGAPHTAQQQR